ncbi:phosphatidylinositol-4-phosphate 5-kinase its3 [Lichtheimia corymbifera JMRC:FSU:9682]|uniref:Phosphatidylinositol-4-phosphate 5-kinase its3 n=1 Tax=Lichtheimia corymbifera JMRC:FSU:9682 TaxID=1263082 RepID=A0A068RXB2_9FUNG|nr:phosphatidylinositol-4-phosphate 5-kinase its3 [Lichtheimia corymbifera JMRC:FSU:9682]
MCEHTFRTHHFGTTNQQGVNTKRKKKKKKSHAPCSAPCLSAVTSTTQEDIQHQHHHNQHSLSHGPCTPPTSPNPDLVFKSSTLVIQQQSSEYIAPSTPPPSRSSTVKRSIPMNTTHTTNNHPSRKFPEPPTTTTTSGSKLLADVQTTTTAPEQQQVATATTSNHHDTTTTDNDDNQVTAATAAATTTIFDPLHPLAHDNEPPSATAPVNIPQKPIRDSDSGRHTFTQSINNYRRASLRSSMSMRRARPSSILDLDPEEQAALKVEIASRRAARRASTRKRRTYADTDDEDDHQDHIRIGTRIAEGHRNYQLMYDMLTGIRIAVGRVSAKMWRDLTDEDFKAAHKLVFDITGNELTPGVKYDFKFKDYAPWVFRHLREKFHVDAADYMENRFHLPPFLPLRVDVVDQQIHLVLKDYYNHVCQNPNTLLSRFYGLHRIKLPRGRKTHFIVMGNVFPGSKDVHLTFDLKGSTFGRLTPEEELEKNPGTTLKDQNWITRGERLRLGPEKRSLFLKQLDRDVELLTRLNIMDYSLLIGIHDLRRGNAEGIRDHQLHVVKTDHMERQMSFGGSSRRGSNADIVRKALRNTSPVQLDSSELPESPSEERRWCIFYADDGGFRSTDEHNLPGLSLYFVGIIDILTPYNMVKKTEHIWKSITQDKYGISAVPPTAYGRRFLQFMKKAVMPSSSSSSSN